MENLSEEVDALFEESDAKIHAILHQIADLAIKTQM